MTSLSAQQMVQRARQAMKAGDRAAARLWAKRALKEDPRQEMAWLILSALAAPRDSLRYAQKALEINPQSLPAQRLIQRAQQRLRQIEPGSQPAPEETAPMRIKARSSQQIARPVRRGAPEPQSAPRKKWGRALWLPLIWLVLAAFGVQMGFASGLLDKTPSPTAQPWATLIISKPTLTFTPTPIPPPSSTPAPTATPTPAPSLTATPQPTSTPRPSATPRPTSVPSATQTEACRNLVIFVKDISVPDYTEMQPGEIFTKTWRLKNGGHCAWTPDYALVFDHGDRMSGATEIHLGQTVQPGDTLDLSVELAAPQKNGAYTGYWKLKDADGNLFALAGGQAFWVSIRVGPTAASTPTQWQPDPFSIPDEVDENTRWIDVDLSQQRVYAYEGSRLQKTFLVSTGTWQHPTVTGQYHIYTKLRYTTMTGPGYNLPNVPYTMYFYQGYGLHGTYWHHNFGTPMSHGCVNLRTDEAAWLFNWASIGTLVNIHP